MRGVMLAGLLALPVLSAGCRGPAVLQQNPTTVVQPNYEIVWNATIRVVEKYFDVAYENRWDGRIESLPQSGATLLEVWRPDAVDFAERVEASLQSIRRRAFVLVKPAPDGQAAELGGWRITVEVYKELEDVNRPIFASFGGGSFISSIEPVRESVVTSAIKPPDGWISLGRDPKLESRIIEDIHRELDLLIPIQP